MSCSDWYEAFSASLNVRFTDADYQQHRAVAEADLRRFSEFLAPRARLLDLGCGVGCWTVPLSTLGYRMVGVDSDPRVVAAARANAERYGDDVEILEADVFALGTLLPPASFDACISGGLLEHFPPARIRELVDLMFGLAPVVVASMPVLTPRTLQHYGLAEAEGAAFADGIHRNLWTEAEWIGRVLGGYTLAASSVEPMGADGLGPDELLVVLREGSADGGRPARGGA